MKLRSRQSEVQNMSKHKMAIWKYRLETWRWKFWGWVMDHYPRLYRWCDKHLPFDTLPF